MPSSINNSFFSFDGLKVEANLLNDEGTIVFVRAGAPDHYLSEYFADRWNSPSWEGEIIELAEEFILSLYRKGREYPFDDAADVTITTFNREA
ncbi:unnamed protein product, partial [Ceratitis capitata]